MTWPILTFQRSTFSMFSANISIFNVNEKHNSSSKLASYQDQIINNTIYPWDEQLCDNMQAHIIYT